jgi:hypothetical protein
LTALYPRERRVNAEFSAFDRLHLLGESATHPLARLLTRLPLLRLLAGPGLRRRCFAAGTRSEAPSGASNYGFQDNSGTGFLD